VPSTSPSYALRFISGKYQGGEFPLIKGREIIIGRSSELDMVLIEDMVSRRHAKIQATDDEIAIMDLGSTNGTFVNGEKIKKARLKEGDRILIGTSIVKLVTVDPATSMSEAEARSQLEKRGQQQALKTQASSRAMAGNIEEIPLPDLLQLFSTSKRTGVLTLKGPQGQGEIYLRKGQIYYASIDDSYDLNPTKAAYRILTWDKGSFELDSTEGKTVLEEIKDSTEGLLMEGMRLLDEFKRIEDQLPPRKAPLQIPRPLVPPLTALKPPELEAFQVVLNGGNTQAVLDKTKLSDVDAAQALIDLISKEYIVAR
jgi:pSer/pThr/pTyr-binding forkhead associated (FHA) protein